MPNAALEEAIKEAYASAPSNVVILETIEIDHPSLADPIRLVKNRESLDFTLEDDSVETFEGAGFKLALPAAGDNGLQDLTLTLDNVDRRISDFINAVKASNEPVEVKYRTYRSDDLTTPGMTAPMILYLRDISVSMFEASGKASFADIINKRFPNQNYTRARFPGLAG